MNIYIALGLVSFIPSLLIYLLPKNKQFLSSPLVRGFGLGVYAALIAILMREGTEHRGITFGLFWFAIGLFVSLLIGILVKEFHHHHEHNEQNSHDHIHNTTSMARLLISDFFHNIVDGIAVISSFSVNPGVGITSLVGILGHQTIQQSGQQILLVENGVTPQKAIFLSFLISLSVFLSIVVQNETLETIFICLSAGIVLWKVVTDIQHTKWSKKTILGFLIGAILISLFLVLIPHEH